MNNILISPVKREKLKKIEKEKRKREMRAALPVLSRDEIRRYRLPLHLALLSELEENGYIFSKSYLEQLIEYQRLIKDIEGPNSIIWLWPNLIDEHKHLERLYHVLKNAEDAHSENNIQKEFDELMNIGVRYGFGDRVWWWLGDQLLQQCLEIGENCETDGHKREALANFLYGKFLTLNKKENEKAKPYLIKSRKLSKSMSWTAKHYKIKKTKEENLFIESCLLLYEIYMQEAISYHIADPVKALNISFLAMKYASNACDRAKEADALLFQGICYLEAYMPRNATVVLLRSLLLNDKLNRYEEVCKGRINLALAYIKVDNFDEAIKHLEALKIYAQEKNLPYYIGQTYRYLGEYYINQGQPQFAVPILEKAVLIFHNLNAAYERLQVNNFSAVARGQLLLRNYLHLLIRSGYEENKHQLMQLIDWKDTRVKFWNDDMDDEDRDSVESTLSVYKVQEEDVYEVKKGMSRIFLSSITMMRHDSSSTIQTTSSMSYKSVSYSSKTTSHTSQSLTGDSEYTSSSTASTRSAMHVISTGVYKLCASGLVAERDIKAEEELEKEELDKEELEREELEQEELGKEELEKEELEEFQQQIQEDTAEEFSIQDEIVENESKQISTSTEFIKLEDEEPYFLEQELLVTEEQDKESHT